MNKYIINIAEMLLDRRTDGQQKKKKRIAMARLSGNFSAILCARECLPFNLAYFSADADKAKQLVACFRADVYKKTKYLKTCH